MEPREYVKRLTEASEKKGVFVREMLEITKKQALAISQEDDATLKVLIEEKQSKIGAIDQLDEEFSVYFHRFKQTQNIKNLDELKEQDIPGLKELQETIHGIMGCLREMQDLEVQNNEKANQVLNELGGKIARINKGKAINRAYYPQNTQKSLSYFFDKKK